MYTGNPRKRTEWYREDLAHFLELADNGSIKPVIDSVVPLVNAQEAWAKLTERTVRGKVLLETDTSSAIRSSACLLY